MIESDANARAHLPASPAAEKRKTRPTSARTAAGDIGKPQAHRFDKRHGVRQTSMEGNALKMLSRGAEVRVALVGGRKARTFHQTLDRAKRRPEQQVGIT